MSGNFDAPEGVPVSGCQAEKSSAPARTWTQDFLSSIVVFLVALPLCLGIAIASGAPPALGLVTGIVGGLLVGSVSGAPLQVSGPAAGLVAIVYEIIVQYKLEGLGMIVLLAGLIQIIAGIFKLGQWFRAISPAVIQGMLAGIGVLIVASQFHVMLDVTPESSGLANIASIPQTILKGLFPIDKSSHHLAAMVGLLSMLVIMLWNLVPKRLKLLPGTLIAVVLAVLVADITNLPIKYVQVPANFVDALTLPSLHSLVLLGNPDIWVMAFTVAVVASAETMLSAAALDKMILQRQALTSRSLKTDYDKEMLAQGIGNTICGFLGALPMTGVIVRSSANIQANAQSRLSTMLHGLWLLALVSLFPTLFGKIPTASLAAILVYTGYKLVQPAAIKQLWKIGKTEVLIYAVTLITVVSTNLLEGVIAGAVLSLVKLLIRFSRLEGRSVQIDDDQVDLFLTGSATFLSLPQLVRILERQPGGKQLTVHIDQLAHLDHACIEVLQNWEQLYVQTGGTLTVIWQHPHPVFEKKARNVTLV
jgi:MFS superfamily sulfate permease-like transporter